MSPPSGTSAPVVVKLGGSVLTRKREVERVRPKVLHRLAEELASCAGLPLVLLHGAGSFGHPGAAKFGLARPPAADDPRSRRLRGASVVAAEVRRLHLTVLRELVDAGVPAASVPPTTHAENAAGRLVRFDPEPFRARLDAGAVPVSFGDVVRDREWGWSILSADTIAVSLAAELRPSRVVFVSDVPGVLTGHGPGPGRPQVAAEVTPDLLDSLRARSSGPDVTGGIRGKVEAMLAIAAAGADAGLISGLKDGELPRAVRGEFVYGSWAHGRPRDDPGPVRDRP